MMNKAFVGQFLWYMYILFRNVFANYFLCILAITKYTTDIRILKIILVYIYIISMIFFSEAIFFQIYVIYVNGFVYEI